MIKSHVTSVLHLLSTLSDDATTRLTLASILSLLPYAMTHRKLVKQLAKAVVGFWSDTSSTDATKIAAFLVLRKLVVIGDAGVKDAVLKETYQGLVKGCRNTTVHSIEGINLMKNSATELWGLDQSIGYTNGFGFIRQLAIHLRSIITNKTKDSYKAIYNWQCVHSLDFWSRVLAQNCSASADMNSSAKSQLFHLIYPVVQVTIGIIRLIPTAEYFPLRFQLLRSLLRLSRATKTYIPIAPMLYEVLSSTEMKRSAKPATVKALDFAVSIRVGKAMLRTRVYQDGLGEQVVELFCEFFALWCKSVSFPELALPVIVMLKRWFKEVTGRRIGNKNIKVNSAIAIFVQKLEANSKWIEQRRQNIGFAPNNRSDVERFLANESWEITPFGAFAVAQRTAREERSKLVRDKEHQSNRRTAYGDDGSSSE
jgi:nucleolar complex protein 2